jgi:hypothetical protein
MRRLLAPGEPPGTVISDLTPLQELIKGGEFGLLHFACHNRFDPDEDASIRMGGAQFTPRFMTTADTHTIDITLVPPEDASREVRGAQDIEDALVDAIGAIRTATERAAAGDDPWLLAEGTIDISFAITRTGTISVGMDGELSGELTNTLRLRLAASAA